MHYVILAFVVALMLIIIYRGMSAPASESLANLDTIVQQYDHIRKNHGTIFDFRSAVGDPSFSAYKYAQLTTLYDQGQLSASAAQRVLAPKP